MLSRCRCLNYGVLRLARVIFPRSVVASLFRRHQPFVSPVTCLPQGEIKGQENFLSSRRNPGRAVGAWRRLICLPKFRSLPDGNASVVLVVCRSRNAGFHCKRLLVKTPKPPYTVASTSQKRLKPSNLAFCLPRNHTPSRIAFLATYFSGLAHDSWPTRQARKRLALPKLCPVPLAAGSPVHTYTTPRAHPTCSDPPSHLVREAITALHRALLIPHTPGDPLVGLSAVVILPLRRQGKISLSHLVP